MVRSKVELKDFLQRVKEQYNNIFNETELTDIFLYYEDDEDDWDLYSMDLSEYWESAKSIDDLFDKLFYKESEDDTDKEEYKTSQDKLNWIDYQYYYPIKIYNDGSVLIRIQ